MYINDVTIVLQKGQGPKINHPYSMEQIFLKIQYSMKVKHNE